MWPRAALLVALLAGQCARGFVAPHVRPTMARLAIRSPPRRMSSAPPAAPGVDVLRAQLLETEKQVENLSRSLEDAQTARKSLRRQLEKAERELKAETGEEVEPTGIPMETPVRSVAKAASWRFIAAIITLSTSLFFSKNTSVALAIVASDFFSKAGFMLLGERVWNRVNWGRGKSGSDTAKRSLVKALVWRLIALVQTGVIGSLITGNLAVGSSIAVADSIFKTALYYVHERAWSYVRWGIVFEPEYTI